MKGQVWDKLKIQANQEIAEANDRSSPVQRIRDFRLPLLHREDSSLLAVVHMTSFVSDYLVTDDLTILLGLIAATVFLLNNLYKPQPLVHPILLGRQSDVARVRYPGESAVYRNYGIGLMGRVRIRH